MTAEHKELWDERIPSSYRPKPRSDYTRHKSRKFGPSKPNLKIPRNEITTSTSYWYGRDCEAANLLAPWFGLVLGLD